MPQITYSTIKYRSPIKVHGGKSYLARRIIACFSGLSKIDVYCEPFCGGANIALNLEGVKHKIIGDIDWLKVNLFRQIRFQPGAIQNFLRRKVPYTEEEFLAAQKRIQHINRVKPDDIGVPVLAAALDYLIVNRMSRGGLEKDFAWSDRMRGGRPGDLNAWETNIDNIALVSGRLQGMAINHREAFEQIRVTCSHHCGQGRRVLFYLDPPYHPETRSSTGEFGGMEFDIEDHEWLLTQIVKYADETWNKKAYFAISGYDHELYREVLEGDGFNRYEFDIANHSGQSEVKQRRKEILWTSF